MFVVWSHADLGCPQLRHCLGGLGQGDVRSEILMGMWSVLGSEKLGIVSPDGWRILGTQTASILVVGLSVGTREKEASSEL